MGDVAFRATNHLVEQLKAEEFASIPAEAFFYLTSSIIQEGIIGLPELPQGKFYFWRNPAKAANDLVIFISNAQPDLAMADEYSRRIIKLAKDFGVISVVGFASMPSPVDHVHEPQVWFSATSQELKAMLKKEGLNLLSEGQVSGMNGLFLGLAKKEGLGGFCLLGQIPLYTIQIDNPRASAAVLKALAKIININLDVSSLLEQAQHIEEDINKLLDYLKVGTPGEMHPISEEDIEKIKKSLGQLTKLPLSIKTRIELLFKQASGDISRANELKSELDKWNVYREYEDRFLDLFKKSKDKNN
jgi:proteasome assembly chaperone (PAC2) family protein